MPYTGTGRWFPQEWFDEMGVQPVHVDITDQEIETETQAYNIAVILREQEYQRIRIQAEVAAEQERLARLAARPPLLDRTLEAFQGTLFRATSIPVYRHNMPPRIVPIIDPLPMDAAGLTQDVMPNMPTQEIEWEMVPGYRQVLNDRTNQIMSIMTDEYEIINDEVVLGRACELFDAAQIEAEPHRHHVTRGKDGITGRTTYMEFNLPEMTIHTDGDGVYEMKVVITNSFDGTKKERLILMLRCANGTYLTAFSQRESLAIKHRTGANARLITEFGSFITSSVAHNASAINMLRQSNATSTDAVAAYIGDNRILSGERNVEKVMGRWMVQGTPLNLWNIYMLFADIITVDYGQNFGPKIAKMEQLNSDVRRVWPNMLGAHVLPVI
jgi:hypothetical protein